MALKYLKSICGFGLAAVLIPCATEAQYFQPQKSTLHKELVIQALRLDSLYATSADIIDGVTYVIVYWQPVKDAAGYNLYRKSAADAKFPSKPVNGSTPIAQVKDCNELKAIVPENSASWQMLQQAFSSLYSTSSTGGKSASSSKTLGSSVITKSDNVVQYIQPKPLSSISKYEISALPHLTLFRPLCTAFDQGLTEAEQELFDLMAVNNLDIRLARGWAYKDAAVTPNTQYVYELRPVNASGVEMGDAQSVTIVAGYYTKPGPPSGVSAQPGDNKVLITWDRNKNAFSYSVKRSLTSSGPYVLIHEEPAAYDVDTDVHGDSLIPPKPGLVDYRRWNDEGAPSCHGVGTDSIWGPANDTTYYYKVASNDILGRSGTYSGYVGATPEDRTAPSAPYDLKVDPYQSGSSKGLALSWRKVTYDVMGHQEQDNLHTYRIFRSDSLPLLEENIDLLNGSSPYYIHSLTADPRDETVSTLEWTDTDPILVPTYGEKDYYYRITCTDANNNTSSPSAAIGNRAPDTTPPGSTSVTSATGHAEHIHIEWLPNTEPDLAGYQIYRTLCNKGEPYRPYPKPQDGKETHADQKRYPCDFFLIGEVLLSKADSLMKADGIISYNDTSLSAGSPVCYAYWVRAFDLSRNLYPGPSYDQCPGLGEYVCERLYEEDAPPVPVIAALQAKNKSVLVKWISSPIQDLRAFHVYRSERENDPPEFKGCVMRDGTVSFSPYTPVKPDCGQIPGEADPASIAASFLDKSVEPNTVYWYRVSALDWMANESEGKDLTKIPALSTFTYSKNLPVTPSLLASAGAAVPGCGLHLEWTPDFDKEKYSGFIVFRSLSKTGGYVQISPVIQRSKFDDKAAHHGTTYWYRVQCMDVLGNLSEPSDPLQRSY